jgi:two-component system response regulator
VGIDITEGKCAEEQLRQSQEQLHLAFDAAQMGYWDCDMRTGTSTWSNNFKRLFGIDFDHNQGSYQAFLEYVHPEDRDRLHQVSLHCLETKQVGDTEFRIIYSDGSIRWIQSKFKFFYDEIGKPLRKIGIDLDITKRKQAEAEIQESLREKEILLQEIHHRVKNNLQVISSLLDLQSQRLTDPTTLKMFQESQNRIKLMALVHETLYRSKDFAKINFADYVKNLTDFLFSAYKTESNNITLELEIDQVFINLDQAIPCAFIISELVSNSLKYAFTPQQKGTIKITIKARQNQWLQLVIADNGVGLPVDCNLNNISSLGLKLVQVLTEQLEGTLELDHRNGTHFTISLPAD